MNNNKYFIYLFVTVLTIRNPCNLIMCMILNDYRSRKPYQCPIAVIDLTNDSDTEEDELASTEPQSTIPIAGNEPVI